MIDKMVANVLSTGSIGVHLGMCLHHRRQSTNCGTKSSKSWIGGYVNSHIRYSTQQNVQVRICNGELVVHEVLVTVQQVLLNIIKF